MTLTPSNLRRIDAFQVMVNFVPVAFVGSCEAKGRRIIQPTSTDVAY